MYFSVYYLIFIILKFKFKKNFSSFNFFGNVNELFFIFFLANPVIDGEKRFKCTWNGCSYATDNRGNFQKHYRIHTGEKPYKCQYEGCSYRFVMKFYY